MGKRTGLNKKHICDIVMALLIQVSVLVPWIMTREGKRISIGVYLFRDFRGKSHAQTYIHTFLGNVRELSGEASLIPAMFWFIAVLSVMIQLLSLFYAYASVKEYSVINGFGGMRAGLLVLLIIAVGLMSSVGFSEYAETQEGGVVAVFPFQIIVYYSLFIVLDAFWMLLGIMLETWDETARIARLEKEQKKLYRKERKERLYFPGRYSKLFYLILWKNLKSRQKYVLFLCLSVFLSTLFLFSGIGIRNVFGSIYNEAASGALGLGLLEIMGDFLLAAVVVSVFLITTILSAYRKKRMGSTGVFHILGVRSRDFFVFWILELAGCFIVSVTGGMAAGSLLLRLLCLLVRKAYPSIGSLGTAGWSVYAGTTGGILIFFLFAFGFSHDMQTAQRSKDIRGAMVQSEEMPGRYKYVWLETGCAIAVCSIWCYTQRRAAESIAVLSIFLMALLIIIYNFWGAWLEESEKRVGDYLRTLPQMHMLRHRFGTSARYVGILVIIHIYFLFFFVMKVTSGIIAAEPEDLYPYDYVLLANSKDAELADEFGSQCKGEVTAYPMVRATTIDNTERLDPPRKIIEQQGQNIGISESTYRELKKLTGQEVKKDLGLDAEGESIHIVYQQDQASRAKPLDWYMLTTRPYLHVGQPLTNYDVDNYEKYYPKKKIAGEEVTSLIGCFKQGKYENLVVFSDAYFEKVKDNWKTTDRYTGEPIEESNADLNGNIYEGPTQLLLINVPEEYAGKADELVKRFREAHVYDESLDPLVDSAYSKETAVSRRQMERVFEITVNSFICIMLLAVSLLLLYMKVEMEVPSMKARYQFMDRIGMRQKERIRAEKKEIARFVKIPLGIAVPLSLVFTVIVFQLRDFSGQDISAYGLYGGGICLIYVFAQLTVMKYLQYKTIRKVETTEIYR